MEIWKDIPGYEGIYQASNEGRIKRLSRLSKSGCCLKERILTGNKNKNGYVYIHLCTEDGDSIKKAHRLVALAFIPNPTNKPEVNHRNGIRHDNRVENLEWVTHSENVQHTYSVLGRKPYLLGRRSCRRKLTDEQVEAIRNDTRTSEAISKDYNVSRRTIGNIKTGKLYRW